MPRAHDLRGSLKVALIAGAMVLFTHSATAQSASDASLRGTDAATFTLTGTVINSVTGEPISRALVQVDGPQIRNLSGITRVRMAELDAMPGVPVTLTDRDGHFKFEGLPRSSARIVAKKPGFFNPFELGEGWLTGATEVNPELPAVTLKLIPEAVITGQITNEKGEPLEGVEVRISAFLGVNGRKQLVQPKTARTDEDGVFRAAELPPGTYYVATAVYANRFGFGAPKTAYPVTYYPGVSEFAEATPVPLAAGERAKLDLSVKERPVVKIAGVVTGYPSGEGVNLQFLNQSGDTISLDEQFDTQTGKFEGHVVASGLCTIKADVGSEGPLPQRLRAQLTFDPASTKPLQVHVVPAASIPVVVRTERAKPEPQSAGRVLLSLTGNAMPASIVLHAADFRQSEAGTVAEPAPDGASLVLRNVDPGRYRVDVRPNGLGGSWYVSAVEYGGTNLLQEDLTVTPGQISTLEVVLRDDGAVLQGSVRSGETGTRAAVLVVPDSAPLDPKMAVAGDNGVFRIDGLAPGDYKVFAFDRLDGLEYANGAALEQYASKAVQVSLRANDNATVTVDVIPRGE